MFIEREKKSSKMRSFIKDYNNLYNEVLRMNDEGVIVLQDDENKWGKKLRLYFNEKSGIPDGVQVTRNSIYQPNYRFRINDINSDKQKEFVDKYEQIE